jgi:putative transcriptional regulator
MSKDELLKKLGARVREIRKTKNMSQLQLAHAIGKDQQSIQRLETGGVNPSFFYLYEIAIGLNVPIEEIILELKL